MIFLLRGELLINSQEYPGTTFREGHVILQAIGSKIEILALTNVEYIEFWFNELPIICEQRYKNIISQSEEPNLYNPLKINDPLNSVLHILKEYLRAKITCGVYLEMKAKELVFALMTFYSDHQLSEFFYPISTYTEGFHFFVMNNYEKVKNVEEFAHLGGYSTTTFRRMFKNMYGIPVYEWILDKKRESILDDLQYSKTRIGEISNRYGFDSMSHFAHFCKASFGDTPRSLRKRAANGEKIVFVKNPTTQ